MQACYSVAPLLLVQRPVRRVLARWLPKRPVLRFRLAPCEDEVSGMALATGSGWNVRSAASAVPLTGDRTATRRVSEGEPPPCPAV